MGLPDLRHFENRGIFFISSDPVDALIDGAWVSAIYTDKGWATADGSKLLSDVTEWRHGKEENSGAEEDKQGDEGVQGGHTAQRQARPRQRANRKKP
jgi:hypothetical protein